MSFQQIPPSGRITTGFTPVGGSFRPADDSSNVPGLGFDFPHVAAISGALRNSNNSSGHHHGHFNEGSFVPFWYGGYPFYPYSYDDSGYDQSQAQAPAQPQPQPQIIVIQQPLPAQGGGASSENGSLDSSAPSSTPQVAEPVRDVGEFVLVRRDGRVLFASMFMVTGTQVTYVTPEGMRHSLALGDLDADATEQMNEARGTAVQIQN